MQADQFAVIGPYVELAVDDVRCFLNGENENEKALDEAGKLYDLMQTGKASAEVKGQGSPELTPEQYAALEWRSADGEPITDEEREAILAGVLPAEEISDERWAAHQRAFRGGWQESSRQAAVWLRKVGETVAADGIEVALSELPAEARDATEESQYRDDTRKAAKYVLTILTGCLALGGALAEKRALDAATEHERRRVSRRPAPTSTKPPASAGEHRAAGGGEELGNAGGVPESRSGFLGGADLADAMRIHLTRRDAFFRQLERQRKHLGDDCWHEVHNPRPNSPRFLYRVDSPKLQELATAYKAPKPA
jgi:hypothetical protein